ncbi:MAG: hypothetical protein L3J43_08170 [Sulfurovum sp.]|nr:hypothetical protein [Sulfurovum sp.]
MAETHVISALISKRAEVSGEINHYEKLLKQSKDNLQSIDHTIHIFDESYDLRTIRAKRVSSERYFKNGEAKTMILDVLRTATKPMNTTSISKNIASEKDIGTDEGFDMERFCKVVLASLSRCESSGLIERVGKDGLSILWQIKP